MAEIFCIMCEKNIGFIEKARIMKNICYLCPDCAEEIKPYPDNTTSSNTFNDKSNPFNDKSNPFNYIFGEIFKK